MYRIRRNTLERVVFRFASCDNQYIRHFIDRSVFDCPSIPSVPAALHEIAAAVTAHCACGNLRSAFPWLTAPHGEPPCSVLLSYDTRSLKGPPVLE